MSFNFPSSPALDQVHNQHGIAWIYNGYLWKVLGKDQSLKLDLDFLTGALDSRITFTRTTPATYINSSGLVASAAINEHRFNHDPVTLVRRGLLHEEQRTNYFPHSGDIAVNGGGNYVTGDGTSSRTANAGVAPDGTNTASLFTVNRSNSVYWAQGGGGASGAGVGTPHFTSIWLKAYAAGDVGKVITLCAYDGGAPFVSPLLNVTLTANWVRYFVSSPAPVWAIEILLGYFPTDYFGTAGAQTGQTQYLTWGGQVEAGAYVTSYISTTTAAVTRAADVAKFVGPTNFDAWYNDLAGTLIAELEPVAGSEPLILRDTANPLGATHMRSYLHGAAGYISLELVKDGAYASGTDNLGAGILMNAVNKIAIGYAGNNYTIIGRGLGGTFGGPTPPPTANELELTHSGTWHLRRLSYWNIRKTDAEIQALTAP